MSPGQTGWTEQTPPTPPRQGGRSQVKGEPHSQVNRRLDSFPAHSVTDSVGDRTHSVHSVEWSDGVGG